MNGMLVSSKIVVKNKEGKILALRRSKTDTVRPLTWDLPGGEVEEGENLEESARREVREETSLEIGPLRFVHADGRNAEDGSYWVVLFSVAHVVSDSDAVVLSYEHDTYEWLTHEEFLERKSSDRIEEFFRDNKEWLAKP